MRQYLKTMAAWKQLLLFIGMAVGIFLIISFAGLLLLSSMTGISIFEFADQSKWDFNHPRMLDFLLGSQLIQFIGLFVVPTLLFAYFSDPEPMRYLGLKKTSNINFYLCAIGLLILSFPVVESLGLLNRQLRFSSGIDNWMREKEDSAARIIEFMLEKRSVKYLLFNIVFIAGFAAVGEELFFRGVLQRIFIRMFKNPWAGIIVTAFLFSAIHMQFYGFAPRFLLGILLGVIYWYSGSLWPAILAHFIYDAALITLAYFRPEFIKDESTGVIPVSQLVIFTLISLGIVFLIIKWMVKNSENSFEKVYAEDFKPHDPFQ